LIFLRISVSAAPALRKPVTLAGHCLFH